MGKDYSLTYISGVSYPNSATNALQTINMAAALARYTSLTTLFVRNLASSRAQTKAYYGVSDSPLRIWSLGMRRWLRWRSRYRLYNGLIARLLQLHPDWRDKHQILMVRHPHEFMFWADVRHRIPFFRNWFFIYEAHDIWTDTQKDDTVTLQDPSEYQRTSVALQQYDLVLAVTSGLAKDLQSLVSDAGNITTLPLCSGLERRRNEPEITSFPAQPLIGYMGTLDRSHGLDDLFRAVEVLPDNYRFQLIGRIKDSDRRWLDDWLQRPLIRARVQVKPQVGYQDIVQEIDSCDVLLAPAGDTIHSLRYRSPLKVFDYMMRGKPIVAADVPGHREILQAGQNTVFYQPEQVESLAQALRSVIEQPQVAQRIAIGAWNQAANHTYDGRARQLLELVGAKYADT